MFRKGANDMKKLYKTVLVAALVAAPFATVQARESSAAHEAWIKAQEINVQPTLTIKETTVPADSVNVPPANSTPSAPSGVGGQTQTK